VEKHRLLRIRLNATRLRLRRHISCSPHQRLNFQQLFQNTSGPEYTDANMRLLSVISHAALLFSSLSLAASSWTFTDGSIAVSSKGAGSSKEGGLKEKCVYRFLPVG
jgi:hypothetical protein